MRYLIIMLTALLACTALLLVLPAPTQAVGSAPSSQWISPSSANNRGLLQATAATTTTLKAVPSPSILTETVLLEAAVTTGIDAAAPPGIVSVYDDGLLIGTQENTNWIGLELTSLTTGTHVFTATYSGDSTVSPSTSAPLTHIVRRSGVRLGLYSEQAFEVTFSFEVVPEPGSPPPDGSVTVSDGISSCTAAASAGRCTITFPSAGLRRLTAAYNGSAILESNVSTPLDYTVQRDFVDIRVDVTPASVDAGQPITVSFVIMPRLANPRWPTGIVTVRVGDAAPVCSVPQTTGSCTFVPAGRFPMRLDYSGDDYYAPASMSLGIRVRLSTSISIGAEPNPVRARQELTLTAGLSSAPACDVTYTCAPTGQVYYYDNGRYLATASVHPRVGYVFPITVALTGIGRHTITGSYSGDTFFSSSISAPLIVQVVPQVAYLPLIVRQ